MKREGTNREDLILGSAQEKNYWTEWYPLEGMRIKKLNLEARGKKRSERA